MTYKEAYTFLKQKQEEIMNAQLMGRGLYPSDSMEAGFVLLPYAKKFSETRTEIASRVFTKLIDQNSSSGLPVNSIARQAVYYADELMEVLKEDTMEGIE